MTIPNSTPLSADVSTGPRPNSVNLGPHALVAFLNSLDRSQGEQGARFKRDFVRWPFRRLAIEMTVIHGGGRVSTFKVASRNLSNGGICVLHNNYIHPGSVCSLAIPHPNRGQVNISGKVVRCMHRSGVVHEVGIAFEVAVQAREFILHDPLSNQFSLECVKPSDLAGAALLIEPSSADREAIVHALRETSLKLTAVSSLSEAAPDVGRVDVVMLSSNAGGLPAAVGAAAVREAGFTGPIVMLVPDNSAQTREEVRDADVDQFVVRPVTEEVLLRALGEVLLTGRARSRAAKPHAA